ncbi:MAG TPA: F0F1 ATP synthase subunit delta [Chloroflexota bacterium]|nr:F0F1 ATP synthase subunit delta [Chloroflexota bacterium]
MIRSAARRYADAVFDLAKQENSYDAWSTDLDRLAALLEVPVAARALTSPVVSPAQKMRVIEAEVPNLMPHTRNLLQLLLHRDRLGLLPDIAAAFHERLNRERGIVTAQVTTAEPLDAAAQAALVAKLSAYVGKQVRLETSVDPSIIGGVVARIGDQLIDGSVRGRLETLRRRLAAGAA